MNDSIEKVIITVMVTILILGAILVFAGVVGLIASLLGLMTLDQAIGSFGLVLVGAALSGVIANILADAW